MLFNYYYIFVVKRNFRITDLRLWF